MKLRATAGILALCAPLAMANVASANYWTLSWGTEFTSNYVLNGVSQSDGKGALQAWAEMENNGFYFGTWASSVSMGKDNVEIDFYGGYRGELGYAMTFDIGYARYMYDYTGDCCGEFLGTLSYAILPNADLIGHLAYDPKASDWTKSVAFDMSFTPMISGKALYGWSDGYDNQFFELGGSLALNENMALNLGYHGSDDKNEGWVGSVSVAF